MSSPLPRVRTSQAVADHVLGLIFEGRLRGGDRIDLDEVASTLGVSRIPVREGLAQLERDGLVTLPHYRGAFVAPFGAATIREAFDLYGLLSAVTFRRVASAPPVAVVEDLTKLDAMLRGCSDVDEFERLAQQFRRVVNVAGAGPHLRALLRSFGGLVPVAARFSIVDDLAGERRALHKEFVAVRSADPQAATTATLDHIALTARNALAALRRRKIIDDGAAGPDERAVHADLVRRMEKLHD